jgi:hypothetical protein
VPLTIEDFVHENNGTETSSTTSHVVSLAGADSTAAGNTVLVFMTMSSAVGVTPPSGFVQDVSGGGGNVFAFRKSDVAASETSWTFTTALGQIAAWYVVEVSNVDLVEPLDSSSSGNTGNRSNGQTLSSGTTSLNAGLSSVAFVVFRAVKANSGDVQSWSGYTNGFEEVADNHGPVGNPGEQIAVARKLQDGSTTTFESTATFATSIGGAAATNSLAVVYRSADSPVVAPLAGIWGFEWGTAGGMGNNSVTGLGGYSSGATGTFGTNYTVSATAARNSSYGLRLSPSAALVGVPLGVFSPSVQAATASFNVRVVSATGTPVVASFNSSTTTRMQLLYDPSATKFGVRCGASGTVQWQSGTTALSAWVYVQFRLRINATTWTADWQIDSVAQTQATLSGQSSSSTMDVFVCGYGGGTQTMTADYDDVVISKYYSAYPLGVHDVKLLTVDTGGTPSVSGTSSNFSVFTANGTLAAWNATNARNAVDDAPPTISASADGVVQTAVAASDYMEFPMATYTCAYDEVIAAVRALFPEWGGTGSGTGTIGYRGYDGTTETTFQAASASYDADSLTAASASYPRWLAAMWPSSNGWTQSELNAAALRVGFSTDATPDMGVHAMYLEVAVRTLDPVRVATLGESDEFKVDLYVHPYTSASVSYVITNDDATRDVTFDYSISGTPQTPVVVGPSANSTLQLNADAFGDISDITLTPEAI